MDLEATCEREGWNGLEQMETIEIGAVVMDMTNDQIIAEYQSFVRPVLTPVLTTFCIEHTSITQHQVDAADSFTTVFPKFCKFIRQQKVDGWGSWGRYDLEQFQTDCDRHGLTLDLPPHVNLKRCFTQARGIRRDVGMNKALKILGLPLEGIHHRGIDDARNIAKIVPFSKEAIFKTLLNA